MGISTDKALRTQLIFFAIICMLIALFISRALLSTAMILFFIFTCFHKNLLRQFKFFFRRPFLVAIGLLFFIPFISGLWSEDKNTWLRFARIKLPLFLLPLAFAGDWQLSEKQWKQIASVFLLLVFGGCCWSLWQYFENPAALHDAYLKAQVLPTPLEKDHVRFSLLVAVAILCAVVLFMNTVKRNAKLLLMVLIVFFTIYLHILSARTGLFCFYIFLLAGFFYLLFTLKKQKWVIVLSFCMVMMPIAAWLVFPTFQNRVRLLFYEFDYVRHQSYLPGANDANRMISLQAGWDIVQQHPLGVGSGDLLQKTNEWYAQHYPQVMETDKLYPSSEWLMYGGFAGYPGIIAFTLILALVFFEKPARHHFSWIMLNIFMVFSFLFDIGLENQFGIFIYAFMVLWWWKWFGQKEEAKKW